MDKKGWVRGPQQFVHKWPSLRHCHFPTHPPPACHNSPSPRWSSGTELARGLRDVLAGPDLAPCTPPPPTFASAGSAGLPLARSSIQTAGYANWKDHGGVYLEYLREKLVSLKADPLAQGVAVRGKGLAGP